MSQWKVTGQAGWCEETGKAVYYVTKGSTSLNKGDHDELERLLNSAPSLRVALDDLVECLTIWEAEDTLPDEWNEPLMRAVAALKLAGE